MNNLELIVSSTTCCVAHQLMAFFIMLSPPPTVPIQQSKVDIYNVSLIYFPTHEYLACRRPFVIYELIRNRIQLNYYRHTCYIKAPREKAEPS